MPKHLKSNASRAPLAWILPILALSPFSLAAKGCNNSGVIGDECPTASDCTSGSAGKGSAGSGSGNGAGNGEGKVCGGLLGAGCADGQFCEFPASAMCGAADQTGTCAKKPEACDLIYAPVCGCDDRTYGNECAAQMAGVSVAKSGECQPSGGGGGGGSGSGGGGNGQAGSGGGGDFCGGIAGVRCPADQYCDYPITTKCGANDQGGSCKPIETGCNKILQPVCGCDGQTYGNACMAASAGVSIAAEGECGSPGKACGQVGDCAKGEYCDFPPEAKCGMADGPGVCSPIPVDSGCITLYDPVCGCDGKTYGNDCTARLAGVSIASKGACGAPTGEICGGQQGAGCQKGYYCDYPDDMACGNADGTGQCVKSFDVCDAVLAEVCGCDGKTYSNECVAKSAGTDISHAGPCK